MNSNSANYRRSFELVGGFLPHKKYFSYFGSDCMLVCADPQCHSGARLKSRAPFRFSFLPSTSRAVRDSSGLGINFFRVVVPSMTVASSSVYYIGLAFCVAVALKVWRQNRLRRGLPLPPGPTGLPFIGSVFQLNAVHPWLTYAQWGKEHGAFGSGGMLGSPNHYSSSRWPGIRQVAWQRFHHHQQHRSRA